MQSSLIWEEDMVTTRMRSQEGKSNNPGLLRKEHMSDYLLSYISQSGCTFTLPTPNWKIKERKKEGRAEGRKEMRGREKRERNKGK